MLSNKSAPKVLLVEDNKADGELLLSLFKKSGSQISFHWLKSGEAALDYLFGKGSNVSAESVALVLLDLRLPGISGFEVLERLKKASETKDVPVIVLTSSSLPQDARRCRELGANDFIQKPGDLLEFEALVERLSKEVLPRYLSMNG